MIQGNTKEPLMALLYLITALGIIIQSLPAQREIIKNCTSHKVETNSLYFQSMTY